MHMAPTTSAISIGTGAATIVAPNPVTTPRPPLKPMNIEYEWPSTAAMAAINSSHGSRGLPAAMTYWTTATASSPLRKSPAKAIAAAPLPSVRRTLVAPVRPLP